MGTGGRRGRQPDRVRTCLGRGESPYQVSADRSVVPGDRGILGTVVAEGGGSRLAVAAILDDHSQREGVSRPEVGVADRRRTDAQIRPVGVVCLAPERRDVAPGRRGLTQSVPVDPRVAAAARDLQVECHIGHGRYERPTVAVVRTAVEHFDQHLRVLAAEEPHQPRLARCPDPGPTLAYEPFRGFVAETHAVAAIEHQRRGARRAVAVFTAAQDGLGTRKWATGERQHGHYCGETRSAAVSRSHIRRPSGVVPPATGHGFPPPAPAGPPPVSPVSPVGLHPSTRRYPSTLNSTSACVARVSIGPTFDIAVPGTGHSSQATASAKGTTPSQAAKGP